MGNKAANESTPSYSEAGSGRELLTAGASSSAPAFALAGGSGGAAAGAAAAGGGGECLQHLRDDRGSVDAEALSSGSESNDPEESLTLHLEASRNNSMSSLANTTQMAAALSQAAAAGAAALPDLGAAAAGEPMVLDEAAEDAVDMDAYDGEGSLSDHRPPALELAGTSEPSPDTQSRGSSGDEGAAPSRKGAHVEVEVFKYQPGVQAPRESLQNYRISQRGAALTGGLGDSNHSRTGRGGESMVSGRVDIASEYEKRKGSSVDRHHIQDHRAKQLLVVPSDDKFVAVAAPEAFSRHSGTCMILGGQGAYSHGSGKSYELKLGNFLRIGSVGVVVSEIHTGPGAGGEHKCLSWEELTCLKGDIAAIQKDLVTLEALTAQEEDLVRAAKSSAAGGGGANGAAAAAAALAAAGGKMCYMCFDDADGGDNPLVAPCDCKGDTRYVHLNCLQKWHTTSSENKVCVILNNKGVRVCTVCKSPYKASVRLPGGDSVSLFQSPLPPPYICFMVVTKHQNNEDLWSTKYQLSFSSVLNRQETGGTRGLVLGRSRACDMVLDYRTVSTKHAMIRYQNGRFYFSDMNSSNGSYLYLREPLQLPFGETVYLKWGSNVVSLKAKRSIRNRLQNFVGRRGSSSGGGRAASTSSAAQDFSILESLCELGQSPTRPPSGERHARREEGLQGAATAAVPGGGAGSAAARPASGHSAASPPARSVSVGAMGGPAAAGGR